MNREFYRKLNRMYRNLGTWREVAKAIGVNERTIRKWWEGVRTPCRSNLECVHEA